MGIKLDNERLHIFDENEFVLTLDFALKMLNIHERRECKLPVILEGETGVGKTALIEMLSKLWNAHLVTQFKGCKLSIIESIQQGQFAYSIS